MAVFVRLPQPDENDKVYVASKGTNNITQEVNNTVQNYILPLQWKQTNKIKVNGVPVEDPNWIPSFMGITKEYNPNESVSSPPALKAVRYARQLAAEKLKIENPETLNDKQLFNAIVAKLPNTTKGKETGAEIKGYLLGKIRELPDHAIEATTPTQSQPNVGRPENFEEKQQELLDAGATILNKNGISSKKKTSYTLARFMFPYENNNQVLLFFTVPVSVAKDFEDSEHKNIEDFIRAYKNKSEKPEEEEEEENQLDELIKSDYDKDVNYQLPIVFLRWYKNHGGQLSKVEVKVWNPQALKGENPHQIARQMNLNQNKSLVNILGIKGDVERFLTLQTFNKYKSSGKTFKNLPNIDSIKDKDVFLTKEYWQKRLAKRFEGAVKNVSPLTLKDLLDFAKKPPTRKDFDSFVLSATGKDLLNRLSLNNIFIPHELFNALNKAKKGYGSLNDNEKSELVNSFTLDTDTAQLIEPKQNQNKNIGLRYEHIIPMSTMISNVQSIIKKANLTPDSTPEAVENVLLQIKNYLKNYSISWTPLSSDDQLTAYGYSSNVPKQGDRYTQSGLGDLKRLSQIFGTENEVKLKIKPEQWFEMENEPSYFSGRARRDSESKTVTELLDILITKQLNKRK